MSQPARMFRGLSMASRAAQCRIRRFMGTTAGPVRQATTWPLIGSRGVDGQRLWTGATVAVALAVLVVVDEPKCREGFHLKDAYDVGDVVGEGAYGLIFRAHRRTDGADVALKAIDRDHISDEDFQREVCALSKLSEKGGHPHVCRMFAMHDDGKRYYVAMELIEGEELFEHLIKHGPFTEVKAARFIRQFAEALSFIHSSGITHGDLKPENLMLSSTGDDGDQLKVVDFGCSINNDDSPDVFAMDSEASDGTTAYWSPEMLKKGASPTPASDMWSTGCILYALLTGSHPFDPRGDATDDQVEEVIKMAMIGPVGEKFLDAYVFNERVHGLSESCVDLMKGLLHPDPKARMTSDEFRRHPWVQGLTASWKIIGNSDLKLERYLQKWFCAAILKKYARATDRQGSTLSEENLRHIFHSLDLDGNGSLDGHELRVALRDLGVNEDLIGNIVASVDLDKSGAVDFDEFQTIMRKKFDEGPGVKLCHRQKRFRTAVLQKYAHLTSGDGGALTEANLRHIFHSMDLDGNGTLDAHEVRVALQGLGVNKDHIASIASAIDLDKNGTVDFDEFRTIMRANVDDKNSVPNDVSRRQDGSTA